MSESYTVTPIAHIHGDFPGKFGIPRQSGLVPQLHSTIVFCPPYRNPDALRGLAEYGRLWLIWQFSEVVAAHQDGENWRPTVRPPRLGGNTRMGVFATRSPFRPNALGLSCVELVEVRHTTHDGDVLVVAGADLMDGTPIYDIKPYLPHLEAFPSAAAGFAGPAAAHRLQVVCPPALLEALPAEKRAALPQVLAQDPRPSYQEDESRVYGFLFAGFEVKFTVAGDVLTVLSLEPQPPQSSQR